MLKFKVNDLNLKSLLFILRIQLLFILLLCLLASSGCQKESISDHKSKFVRLNYNNFILYEAERYSVRVDSLKSYANQLLQGKKVKVYYVRRDWRSNASGLANLQIFNTPKIHENQLYKKLGEWPVDTVAILNQINTDPNTIPENPKAKGLFALEWLYFNNQFDDPETLDSNYLIYLNTVTEDYAENAYELLTFWTYQNDWSFYNVDYSSKFKDLTYGFIYYIEFLQEQIDKPFGGESSNFNANNQIAPYSDYSHEIIKYSTKYFYGAMVDGFMNSRSYREVFRKINPELSEKLTNLVGSLFGKFHLMDNLILEMQNNPNNIKEISNILDELHYLLSEKVVQAI